MKIIKINRPPDRNQTVRFDCPICKSRLEESKRNMGLRMYRNEEYYTFVCPVCKESCMVSVGDLEAVR